MLPKLVFSFLLFTASLFLPQNVWAENLLVNADFEEVAGEKPTNWDINYSTVVVKSVTSPVQNGSYAVSLSKSASGYGYLYQTVSITPQTTYTFSGWGLLNDDSITNLKLRIEWYDQNSVKIGETKELAITTKSTTWQNLSGEFIALESASQAKIEAYFYLKAGNPVSPPMFDNLTFEKKIQVSQEPTTPSTPPNYPTGIQLSEFLPNPATSEEKEWVELYNSSTIQADISGFKIDDIEGGSSPLPIPEGTIMGPNSYRVFYFPAYKLNNTEGDTVRLIRPDGVVIDSYSYIETTKGYSYAKDAQGNWTQTETPTPGQANFITLPQETTPVSQQTSQPVSTSQTTTQTKSPTQTQSSKSSSSQTPSVSTLPPKTETKTTPEIKPQKLLSQISNLVLGTATSSAPVATGEVKTREQPPPPKEETLGKIFLGTGAVLILGAILKPIFAFLKIPLPF